MFARPHKGPLCIAIANSDPEILAAYAQARATLSVLREHLLRPGDHFCCAKLRFRDPEPSERLGEDRFVLFWLAFVEYHADEQLYSGQFVELPASFTPHRVGERITFAADQVYDWYVNDEGHLHGGFTMRVARAHLPQTERSSYDRYTGVTVWEPLPSSRLPSIK